MKSYWPLTLIIATAVGVSLALLFIKSPSSRSAAPPAEVAATQPSTVKTTPEPKPPGAVSATHPAQTAPESVSKLALELVAVESPPTVEAAAYKKASSAVLRGRGADAQVVDAASGERLWQPEGGRIVSGMELSPNGSNAMITFAVRTPNEPATVIYSVPNFNEIASLPDNVEEARGTGFRWEWLGEATLVGVCKIEKQKEQLSNLTAAERGSDLAIESVKLFVYDLKSRSLKEVETGAASSSSPVEIGEVRKDGAIQIWSQEEGFKWYSIKAP